MIRFLRWFDWLRGKPAVTPPTCEPAKPKEWDLEDAIKRDRESPWKKNWIGAGIPRGMVDLSPGPSRLHDHPRSRPTDYEKCPDCGFPQFGWGPYDHWPECKRREAAKMWEGRPEEWSANRLH